VGEAGTPVFKFGAGAPVRPGGVPAGTRKIDKIGLPGKYVQDLFRVILPVRGDEDSPIVLQAGLQEVQKFCRDQAPFVVAFLGPGIGEENVNHIEAVRRQLIAEDIHHVMTADANIGQAVLFNPPDEAPHSRPVYLDGEIIIVLVIPGQGCSDFTHAGADVQDFRSGPLKQVIEIQPRCAEFDAILAPVFLNGQPLGVRHAAFPQYVTADPPGLVRTCRQTFPDQKKRPSIGEEALA